MNVLAFSALVVVVGLGCAPQWYYSYAELEQARASDRSAGRPEREAFLFYKDHLDAKSGQMQDVLDSPLVKPLINGKIRAMLVTDFASNQRYMAQYGVSSVPALVVVHTDGTYHAREGLLSPEQTRGFLEGAVAPGLPPKTKIEILPVAEYHWHGSYEEAVDLADRQNRPLFIVYKWWLSAESTELLQNRLSQPRTRTQFANMVHCLLDWDYVPNRAHVAKYGVSKVPAMIVVRPDGTYHPLVGLPTVDQIVQFAVRAKSPGRYAPRNIGSGGVSPTIDWHYNFERAKAAAHSQRRNLFAFYHSVFADASNRAARLFGTPEAVDLLDDMVCCRFDWVVVKNRRIAEQFNLTEPPAYVVLRPDGTYHARNGPITIETLADLLKAAEQPGTHPRSDDKP